MERKHANGMKQENGCPKSITYAVRTPRFSKQDAWKARPLEKSKSDTVRIERVHKSEVIIIHFTDGSIMGLETGSNAGNVASDNKGLRPEDFHVNFRPQWVPELPRGMRKHSPRKKTAGAE